VPVLFNSILKAAYSFPDPYWTHISAEAKDLIRNMMVHHPGPACDVWFSTLPLWTPSSGHRGEVRAESGSGFRVSISRRRPRTSSAT